MENLIKIDDLGVPLFLETSIWPTPTELGWWVFFFSEIMGVDRPYRTYESRTRLSFVSHSMELFEAAKLYEIPLIQKEPAAFMNTNSIGFSSSPNVQRFFSSQNTPNLQELTPNLRTPQASHQPRSQMEEWSPWVGGSSPGIRLKISTTKNMWNKPPSEIQPCTGQIGDIPSLPARESFREIRTSWAIFGEGGLLERGKFLSRW